MSGFLAGFLIVSIITILWRLSNIEEKLNQIIEKWVYAANSTPFLLTGAL